MPDFGSLAMDERLALRSAAENLRREFDGVFGTETIERFLTSSYDEFAPRARVRNFLVLMAERFARERSASPRPGRRQRSDRHADRTVPVRAQRRAFPDGAGLAQPPCRRSRPGWSGGSDPSSEINSAVVAAMAEIGVDISDEFPKPWTDEIVRAADVVITMGCGDACPVFPGKRYLDWELTDPSGLSVEQVRPIRDELGRRVATLVEELTATPTPA